ncbi:hypothetical protein [Leptolyngbya sp. PCC 6406]|uniref:hypothetical protein n=1 Tax=Leptolyngbya sp. PCC 6406 TaxID=1173264 RepID=UPI0002ABDB44|nr:hypothetical protein [Leptolyngbya sp. PCC 6406]
MPFNVNGIGTTYYGRRDFRPDGSYITTEWFIFLMVPIAPLRTFRVWPIASEPQSWFAPERYQVQRLKRCWPQIRRTYWAGLSSLAGCMGAWATLPYLLKLGLVPFFLALILLVLMTVGLVHFTRPPDAVVSSSERGDPNNLMNQYRQIWVTEAQLRDRATVSILHPEKASRIAIALHPDMKNRWVRCSGVVAGGRGHLLVLVRVRSLQGF